MNCPTCGDQMRQRTNRRSGSKFWGCSNYPRCRGTRPLTKDVITPKTQNWASFTPSTYQDAIGKFLAEKSGNLVVEAGPGSGKTTLLEWLVSNLPTGQNIALLAFNKKIAVELQSRIQKHGVYISTLHSLGYANIRSSIGKVKVDQWKWRNLLRDMQEPVSIQNALILEQNDNAILNLVSKRMATMSTDYAMLINRFNIDIDGDFGIICKFVDKLYNEIMKQDHIIGYDEMIYFSATGKVSCRQFDIIFVDETQDLNRSQITMLQKSLATGGRIIAVGDRWQSIYSFRGADSEAIPNVIEAFGASTLPLSISYRMPVSHVDQLNDLFPWAPVEPAPNAQEGIVKTIKLYEFETMVKDGDLVLCRCNAPLVTHAFRLLRQGIKVVILGRDIGRGLVAMIHKVCKKQKLGSNPDIVTFFDALSKYERQEIAKLNAAGKEYRAAFLSDKIETIYCLGDGAGDVKELCATITRIFSDDQKGVTFSTVHKAKGCEANRVFILNANELGSHPKATREWERQQELNIAYVAYSRSKRELYLINKESEK